MGLVLKSPSKLNIFKAYPIWGPDPESAGGERAPGERPGGDEAAPGRDPAPAGVLPARPALGGGVATQGAALGHRRSPHPRLAATPAEPERQRGPRTPHSHPEQPP